MSRAPNRRNESISLINSYCEAFGVDAGRISVLDFGTCFQVTYMQPRTDVILQVTDDSLPSALIELARMLHGGDIDALQRCMDNVQSR